MSEHADADADVDVEREEEGHEDVDTSHLDDVSDGCGCAEVWEHTSAQRE